MRKYNCILLCLLLFSVAGRSQSPARGTDKQPVHTIRIVDTLSSQEQAGRNPILLQSELDSLAQQWNQLHPPPIVTEPVKEVVVNKTNSFVLAALFAIIVLLLFVVFLFYRQQRKVTHTLESLREKAAQPMANTTGLNNKEKKGKTLTPEGRIQELNAELGRVSKENEELERLVKEYNGIEQEYNALRKSVLSGYKVRNYPGFDKDAQESIAMQGVMDTERKMAAYAYEKFVKPLLAIVDANKNSPAKISDVDRQRSMDLLVSLSLFYIEYLYLRIQDLSVGGKMVERIQALGKGKAIDPALLKELNTEFGSRALVVKLVLERSGLTHLSYPVFDETNLNHQ